MSHRYQKTSHCPNPNPVDTMDDLIGRIYCTMFAECMTTHKAFQTRAIYTGGERPPASAFALSKIGSLDADAVLGKYWYSFHWLCCSSPAETAYHVLMSRSLLISTTSQ